MTKHHYVRVYADGPNAFWYSCAVCEGKGYTEEGYDITYADLCTLPTQYTCEQCVADYDLDHERRERTAEEEQERERVEYEAERDAEYAQRKRDAAEGFDD